MTHATRSLAQLTAAFLTLTVLAAAPSAAQTTNGECDNGVPSEVDSDRDCIPGRLEVGGYDRSLQPCAPGTDGCFVTDSLTWSSDGDPYSDYQEATGVGMEGSVPAPYDHPLVAAMPQIEVVLEGYTYTPTTEIRDAQGGSLATTESEEFTVESTVSTSYTEGVEVGTGGASASAEVTVSASLTAGYTTSSSRTEEVNWETARSDRADAAAVLTLFIQARNTGGASAQFVQPTFNLFIGGELVGTVKTADPMPTLTDGVLAPRTSTDRVAVQDRQVGSGTEPLTVSLRQLRRLRRGAPVEIRLIGLSANVVRWQSGTSNWECGSADSPCRWGTFIQQIESRTTRLLLDFGYSGDPDADVPNRYFGTPFDYRVFTGSNSLGSAGHTLRDALRFLGLADEVGGQFRIIDRPFPSQWAATSGPLSDDRDWRFLEHWEDRATASAEWPRDLLDFVLPRETELALMSPSPDPGVAGPIVTARQLGRDLRSARVAALPKGGFAVRSAEAHLLVHGEERVVEMVREPGTDYFILPAGTALPISAASSYVVVEDSWGSRRTASFEPTIPQVATCADLPASARQASYFERPFPGTYGYGNTTVFVDGDLDKPATVFCFGAVGSTPGTDYWYGQPSEMGSRDVRGVAVLDVDRRVAVGEGALLRSEDGGQTWIEVPLPNDVPSNTSFLAVSFREGGAPDAEVGVAVASNGVFVRTDDGGRSWTRVPSSTEGLMEDVDYAGGDTWFAVGQGRIRRSDDDGLTWQSQGLQAVDADGNPVNRPNFATFTAVEFIEQNMGVVGDASMADGVGRIYATKDGGATWRETAVITQHHDVAYNGHDGWAIVQYSTASPGRILHVPDLLEPVDPNTNPLTFAFRGGGQKFWAVDFATPAIGFAVSQGGPVYRTEDGGLTWEQASGYPTPSQAGAQFMLDIDMLDPNVGAIVGTDGAIGATDSGGGFLTYETDRPVAGEEAPEPLAPGVSLAAPAPNPFRTATRIRYALDAPGRVRLAVYDALGREVAVLEDGDRAADEHETRFEASGLAVGVYVVRLAGEDAVATRTVTVVR